MTNNRNRLSSILTYQEEVGTKLKLNKHTLQHVVMLKIVRNLNTPLSTPFMQVIGQKFNPKNHVT
jgi:hypothetical protein